MPESRFTEDQLVKILREADKRRSLRPPRSMSSPSDRITLHPLSTEVRPEGVLGLSSGTIYVCDCYLAGAENGRAVVGGFEVGRIVNVDHHAPVAQMARQVSSANLAIERVRALGPASAGDAVVINHTDCDSILSAGIMAGLLGPDDELGEAAIAADHTGAAHEIADLLQALDELRDIDLSIASLDCLRAGRPLPAPARLALATRRRDREQARRLVAGGRFSREGGLFWADLDEVTDGEFFPALLPEATLILVACPMPDGKLGKQVKLRLGLAAPACFSLDDLGLRQLDPNYGGRWNAGSNKRGEGTTASIERYARDVARLLEDALGR